MPLDYLYNCIRCKKKVDGNHIRYDLNGVDFICIDCWNVKNKKENFRVEVFKENKEEDKLKFICIDCRYKFSFDKDSRNLFKCPYCGSIKLMENKATAEQLIEDAGQGKYDNLFEKRAY